MQDIIVGKYRLSKSENFDAFLSEIGKWPPQEGQQRLFFPISRPSANLSGLGYIKRKLAQSTNPEITISRDGDKWSMLTSSALSTSDISFTLDEEFEEQRQDGVTVTSRISADGNTWTQTQKPGNGKDVTIVREFTDNELKVTSTINNVVSNRVYERI